MFDPFESNSLLKRKELGQRKVLLLIFVPLILFSIISGISLYMAWQASERSYIHPECACRRILKENPRVEFEKPIFNVS